MATSAPTHYRFRRGDTTGSIALAVTAGLGSTASSATALFSARNADGDAVITGGTSVIGTPSDAADGTKAATITYALTTNATASVGRYWGQFSITYSGGATQVVPSEQSLTYEVLPSYALLSVAETAADVNGYPQVQASHNFLALDLIYWTGSAWAKAKADAAATLADAMVYAVDSSSAFRLVYFDGSERTFTAHAKGSGGAGLYLSQATAGLCTVTAPVSGRVQQVGIIKDANTLILQSIPLVTI